MEDEYVYGVPNGEVGKLVAVVFHESSDEGSTAQGEPQYYLLLIVHLCGSKA